MNSPNAIQRVEGISTGEPKPDGEECPECGEVESEVSWQTSHTQSVCSTDDCPVNTWDPEKVGPDTTTIGTIWKEQLILLPHIILVGALVLGLAEVFGPRIVGVMATAVVIVQVGDWLLGKWYDGEVFG